ncbi:MAG: DUF6883 domain-containing protein [Cyanobacteria bacterium P01_C01_bin.118]
MKLGEIVSEVSIDPGKFRDYALDPNNPVGRHKALVFQRKLGYNQENYEGLLNQIVAQAMDSEAIATKKDEHGQRYQVDLEVDGIESGQQAIVRTGWIVEPKAKECARLVTLYVRK